jgi:hypothetical protein
VGKVQLETPLIDSVAPLSEPAVLRGPDVPDEAKFDWYWCASCYIVTEHSGNCPSCPRPLTAVVGDALPYGPYLPRSTRPRRRRLGAAPVAAVSLIVVAAIAGGLLFRAGNSLGGTAAGSSAVHTTVTVPVLGPMSVAGQWTADASGVAAVQQEFAGNNAVVHTVLTNGYTRLAVVTLPTAPPGGKSTNVGDACTFSDGTKCVITGEAVLIIGGNTTLRIDKTGVQTTEAERLYFIVQSNQRIVVDIDSTTAPTPFAAIETALLSYPKSVGPQQ